MNGKLTYSPPFSFSFFFFFCFKNNLQTLLEITDKENKIELRSGLCPRSEDFSGWTKIITALESSNKSITSL